MENTDSNVLETQLLIGKGVLEILLDLVSDKNKEGAVPIKHRLELFLIFNFIYLHLFSLFVILYLTRFKEKKVYDCSIRK